MRGMSYDLAVWEGDRPADDAAAAAEFERLYEVYVASGTAAPAAARVVAYARALLDRYPDIGTEAGEDSPWSTAPLLGEVTGPLMYFPMVWSRCEEVSAWAVEVAREHGLVCFDPQWNQLRPPAGTAWRFELTSERGRPLRDPDPEALRRAVVRVSRDNPAVLRRADGWYVQVGLGYGARAGWYALERQEGGPDRHFRTETSDIQEVVKAFIAFLDGDPSLVARFAWRPHVI